MLLEAAPGDDRVGVQAYTRRRIDKNGVPVRDVELTQTGWEYHREALGGAVRRVARVVSDLPIIVTENGIATADDARRIAYTAAALLSLRAAMDDGIDTRLLSLEHA